jgi:3-deoxy-D-manno-octulosonate 8-phosphate phosphatase (KDO 8-P phosphatase)
MSYKKLLINDIDSFIFDFDGVLTNNLVYFNQSKEEMVVCNRSDGLAFDVLRKLKKTVYILSTEKNPVVSARAEKLKIPAIQGINNKVEAINMLQNSKKIDLNRALYVGNDINDFCAMKLFRYSACPLDSHHKIKEISSVIIEKRGGEGVVRELVEDVFELDFIKILYN